MAKILLVSYLLCSRGEHNYNFTGLL